MTSCSPAVPPGSTRLITPSTSPCGWARATRLPPSRIGRLRLPRPAQQGLAARRRVLRVRVRPVRAGPGAAGSRSGPRSRPAGRSARGRRARCRRGPRPETATGGEPGVDLHAALERPERAAQPLVDPESSSAVASSCACSCRLASAAPVCCARARSRNCSSLERLDVGRHDEDPEPARRAAQRVGPGPRRALRPPPGRRSGALPASRTLQSPAGSPGARATTTRQRANEGTAVDRELEDLPLPGALGHELPEHEQAAHRREQPPSELVGDSSSGRVMRAELFGLDVPGVVEELARHEHLGVRPEHLQRTGRR